MWISSQTSLRRGVAVKKVRAALLRRRLDSQAWPEFERAWSALASADSLEYLTRVLRLRAAIRLDRRKDAETLARRLLDNGFRDPQFLRIVKDAFPERARTAGDR